MEPDIALWRERAAQVRRLAQDLTLDVRTRNTALELARSWETMAERAANVNRFIAGEATSHP